MTYLMAVQRVTPHPFTDTLDVVTLGNNQDGDLAQIVANHTDEGASRWAVGDSVVVFPNGSVLPDDLLRAIGYWDADKNRGALEGRGNRVKSRFVQKVVSDGIAIKVYAFATPDGAGFIVGDGPLTITGKIGDNVADQLGVTQYVSESPKS